LLDCRNLSFHALQKEITPDDRTWLRQDGRIVDHSAALGDFADTAALIDQLDLVVTIDTSVAHLAGAMGKPVWIMLQYSADWRWGRDGAESLWYPTARLFRQTRRGDWDDVATRIAAALGARFPADPG
jgi:ADP-heptose:LPS heptosyltransferase